MRANRKGFTIVELLIVIVVVAILATISVVAYNGIQQRARDMERVTKVKNIAQAIELYKVDNGRYPPILDAPMHEADTCSSATANNWGHCDRAKILSDMLAPYIKIVPESLSVATQGDYYYWYTSSDHDNYQTYGLGVFVEGDAGQNDGGTINTMYEAGTKPKYCADAYPDWPDRDWRSYHTTCRGGN